MTVYAPVSASFTGVDDASGTLTVPRTGQTFDVNISGTYAMVIDLERAVGSDELAWRRVKRWNTANATVNETLTSERSNEKYRLRVHTDTSGTAVVSLRLLTASDRKVTDALGAAQLEYKDDGVHVMGIAPERLKSVDPAQRVAWFNDFLGDLLPDEIDITVGSGTANAVALSPGAGGRVAITSASDDGAITANASSIALDALDWRADQGGLVMETRIQIDDISEAYVFIGFTDVLPSGTHEAPIFLVTTAIDSDAANAVGVAYDADGTTKEWFHGGVKADTDTAPVYSGSAPVQATYETVRVEVDANGTVQGFINGNPIGDPVENAVTVTTPLVPTILVANRSANQVIALVDYWYIAANR